MGGRVVSLLNQIESNRVPSNLVRWLFSEEVVSEVSYCSVSCMQPHSYSGKNCFYQVLFVYIMLS